MIFFFVSIVIIGFVKAARLPQWSNLGIVLNNGNFQVSGWGDSKGKKKETGFTFDFFVFLIIR